MKARRLPGVRCSTLKTECRSLLCLMIMPGRSWVAGIDIARNSPCTIAVEAGGRRGKPQVPPPQGLNNHFTRGRAGRESRGWMKFINHGGHEGNLELLSRRSAHMDRACGTAKMGSDPLRDLLHPKVDSGAS